MNWNRSNIFYYLNLLVAIHVLFNTNNDNKSLLFPNVPVVKALDIGNAIKNIGRNNKLKRDEKSTQQQITDASTGTITADRSSTTSSASVTEAPKEREPTSCNEIMAKAVVLASEEKDAALQEKEKALAEANKANERADTLASQIDKALLDARNATIEYEATRLMTDRLVNDVKKQYQEMMDTLKEDHSSEVEKHRVEMEDWKKEANEEMEALKNLTKEQIESIESQTKIEIESAKLQAKQTIDKMKHEIDVKEQTLREQTGREVTITKEDAQAKVDEIQTKLDLLAIEMTNLQKATKLEIESMEEKADQEINKAKVKALSEQNEAWNKADEVEMKLHKVIDSMSEEFSLQIRNVRDKAQKEYDSMKNLMNEEKERILKNMDKQITALEAEMTNLKKDASTKQFELQGFIDNLNVDLNTYKAKSSSLGKELQLAQYEVEYWKQVGSSPLYVNTTLIYEDTISLINNKSLEAKRKVQQQIDITKNKAEEISKPHREKLVQIYEEQLKETIHTKVIPFHHKYLIPIHTKYVVPMMKKVSTQVEVKITPLYNEFIQKVQEFYNDIYDKICIKCQTSAVSLHSLLQEKATTPQFVLSSLKDLERNASLFVDIAIKVHVCFMVYVFRYFILFLVLNLVKIPCMVVWFLCPLRFLIGGSKPSHLKKRKSSGGSSREKSNGSSNTGKKSNGTSANVKSEYSLKSNGNGKST